jgi:hypothetical protein
MRQTNRLRAAVALGLVLAVGAAAAVARQVWADPGVVLLVSGGGADWVRVDRPFEMRVWQNAATTAEFETTFAVPRGFGGATLSVAALRAVAVYIDERLALDTGPAGAVADWKVPREVPLSAGLAVGSHRLRLAVSNRDGPALVRASCGPLGIYTGRGAWSARTAGGGWAPAVRAADPWRPALAGTFGTTLPALGRWSPLLLVPFAAGAVPVLLRLGSTGADWGRRARWAVLAAWVVLGAADVYRVPVTIGYDVVFHYEYIRYVVDHGRLPPPDGGVQFFQAPLYYLVSAGLWRILAAAGASGGELPYLMRLVPLACGAGLAEVCYRTARHAFPGRGDLQAVAVVVGGLMPVNLYMGLVVSNEPMAGCVGGAVAMMGVRFLSRPADAVNPRWLAVAGAALGLAVLTKVSMALWAVPLTAAVTVAVARGRPARQGAVAAGRAVAVMASVSVGICVPYLVRTWRAVGAPVISHGILRGIAWWQDPGYRTPRQFLSFGRGLTRVAYGGIDSVWDSLYSTVWGNGFLSGMADFAHRSPWHLDAMACGLWLGLPMSAAMGVGAVAGRVRGGRWFPSLAVGAFVLAVLWIYLTLPIYSCAKGSYLLSTLPCAAVLAAAGADRVIVGRRSRAVVVGLLSCWAATSYLTYVVTG